MVAPDVFTMFDNDYDNTTNFNDATSELLEITVNETSMTAQTTWNWEAPPQYYTEYLGANILLPNGDWMGDFGSPTHQFEENYPWNFVDSGADIIEVTPAGQIVRTISFPTGWSIYRVSLVTELNASASSPVPFGNMNVGSSNQWGNSRWLASAFTSPDVSGTLTDITAYVYGDTSGFGQCALYADNGGSIGSLLATGSDAPTGTGSPQWCTSTISYAFSPNTVYWLAFTVHSAGSWYDSETASSTAQQVYESASYWTSPDPFDVGDYRNVAMSIYADYTTSTSPAPSPSPSPSPSPTETFIPVVAATASSYNGPYTPQMAIDGIESTSNYWGTSASLGLPQWLQLDLGSVVTINEVYTHFYDGDARVYTYYIQTSTDGSAWTTVVSSKTGSSAVTDTFSDVSARYIRITVTDNTANTAAHIEQAKVYSG
jgi:hypothetical protein